MSHSIGEHCQAALERYEQAKAVNGEERRVYLHDALAKLTAAVDVFATELAKKPPARVLPFRREGGRGA